MSEVKKKALKKVPAKKKAKAISPAKIKKTVTKKAAAKKPLSVKTKKTLVKKTAAKKVAKVVIPKVKQLKQEESVSIPSPFFASKNETKDQKKLNVKSRFLMTANSLITLIQFDKDEVAIQVARYGGVLTIVVGAIFTVYLSSTSYSIFSTAENKAEVIGATNYDLNSKVELPITADMVSFDIAAPSPLRENVPVIVQIASQRQIGSVLLMIQNTETNQSFTIGFAEKKTNNTFEKVFDTSSVPNGKYRFVAKVAADNTQVIARSGSPFDILNYIIEPKIKVVEPVVENVSTNTTSESNNELTNTIKSTADISTSTINTGEEVKIEPNKTIYETQRGKISVTKISAEDLYMLQYNNEAQAVEFFAKREGSTASLYIGRAYSVEEAKWQFAWNTKHTPVGKYSIFAKVYTTEGILDITPVSLSISRDIPVLIKNLPVSKPAQDVASANSSSTTEGVEQEKVIETVVNKETIQNLREELSENNINNSEISKLLSIPPESANLSEDRIDLSDYEISLQPELDRLAAALRAGDKAAVEDIVDRIKSNQQNIIDSLSDSSDEEKSVITASVMRTAAARVLQTERSERIVRDRLGEMAVKDSDGDGITDYDENELFGTDPNDPDSDGDGFSDGAEVLGGYNPRDPSSEAVVALQSAKDFGSTRSDILKIKDLTTLPQDLAISSSPAAIITGIGLPNSFVNLFIYSNPIIVAVKTDEFGNWSYQFDKEIEDGEHEIYVGMTDNAGKIVAKSSPLKFIKTAEAYTPLQAEAAAFTSNVSEDEFLGTRNLLLVSSVSVVAIGLLLLLLGHFLRFTKRENLSDTSY